MTVGELRKALDGLAANMEVVLEIISEERGDHDVCGLHTAVVEARCTDTEALMLSGHQDDDESDCAIRGAVYRHGEDG